MRSLLVLWMMLAVAVLGWTACSSDGAAPPPEAELFADPEVCDVPCEVVLDSGVEPAAEQELTYTWDLGEGPVSGGARLLHRFESAGTYEVTVTVSDGQSTTDDTTTVLVEEQPKARTEIDEAGGSVSQGACSVTIPLNVAPEAIELQLTQLPSMVPPAARAIGVGELTALGSAYDVDMPLKPSEAVAISVQDPGAQGVDPSELAWLVRMIAHPVPPADGSDFEGSQAPLADYVLVPVTRVDEDGTAHGEIYDRKRFQLVQLSEPLDAEVVPLVAAAAPKAATPAPIITFKRNPTRITITNFKNAIVQGLADSRAHLMDSRGYRGPDGAIVVYVGPLPKKWDAYVPFFDRHTIHLSHTLTSEDHVKKVVAHEFFHLIQNHYTNRLSSWSYHELDGWFAEGTATWAMDEVYDQIRGLYHATPWSRFDIPILKAVTNTVSRYAYHNVAFWKYAETFNTGIIKRMLEDHYANTHSTLPGARNPVENVALVDHLLSFKKLWSDVDFLDFTYRARYLKDFDISETRDDELWSKGSDELGEPKAIIYKNGTIISQLAGASEDDAVEVGFTLAPHGTADVIQVESLDLSGTLNVRFLAPFQGYDAMLIVVDTENYDVQASDTVRNISGSTGDLMAKLTPDELAYIFVVDPQWNYPPGTPSKLSKLEVWIEDPCGGQPQPDIEVSTEGELQDALQTMSPGSVIKLAAGTYSPPLMQWPTPEFGPFGANLLVRDMTLVGAGSGQTTIVMTGDPYGGIGLKTYGSATIKNLTIEGGEAEPIIDCLDAQHVTLCDVTVEAGSNTDFGIIWGPWNGGSTSLSIYDSTLAHPNREQLATGIMLQSCYETPATVSATVSDTNVSGWLEGVVYYTGEGQCGSVSVTADCEGFSNNEYNVVQVNCGGGMCTYNDQCPNPSP